MESNIRDIVKPVEINGKVLTHRDTSKEGVNQYQCSTFIKKKNILVKGEYEKIFEYKRNAMILSIDGDTGNIIGESRV